MIIMPVKEGENIERALKKFKRKYERTGVLKELRRRQYFTKPSIAKREAMHTCTATRNRPCKVERKPGTSFEDVPGFDLMEPVHASPGHRGGAVSNCLTRGIVK